MRRAERAELRAHTELRLARLSPQAAGPVDSAPDEGGWVLPPERSWDPPELGPQDTPPAPWSAGLRLSVARPAVLGLIGVAVAGALLAGALVIRSQPSTVVAPVLDRAGQALTGGDGASPAPGSEVVVSVVGKVRRPGLVRLPAGARVDDAVRAAGGATAGLGLLNVARKVVDGEQVVVGLDPSPGPGGGSASTGNGRLDLNTAGVGELDALPGIGPVLAQRIVDWRTEHGRFASVDQLREVPGIGESKYVALKSKVAV